MIYTHKYMYIYIYMRTSPATLNEPLDLAIPGAKPSQPFHLCDTINVCLAQGNFHGAKAQRALRKTTQ